MHVRPHQVPGRSAMVRPCFEHHRWYAEVPVHVCALPPSTARQNRSQGYTFYWPHAIQIEFWQGPGLAGALQPCPWTPGAGGWSWSLVVIRSM